MKITNYCFLLFFFFYGCSENDSKSFEKKEKAFLKNPEKANVIDISNIRNKLVAIEIKDEMGNGMIIRNRVVGLPGDLILIQKSDLYINGKKYLYPESTIFNYRTKFRTDSDVLIKNLGNVSKDYENFYNIFLKNSESIAFKKKYLKNIESFKKEQLLEYNYKTLLNGRNNFGWDLDNFGPIRIPKIGYSFSVDSARIFLFDYNKNDNISGQFIISDNYFFLLSDDFHNGSDSRQFGLVSESRLIETINNN